MPAGISFNEMGEHLKQKGYEFEQKYEKYLEHWFFSNFFHYTATWEVRKFETASSRSLTYDLSNYHNSKCVITGEAYIDYLEYVELKEARAASKRAMWIAIIAIFISIVVGLPGLISTLT